MYLIPASFLAIVFFLACAVQLHKREWEHAFTRFVVAVTYSAIAFYPSMPIETARFLSRWGFLLLGGIELISWVVIRVREGNLKA